MNTDNLKRFKKGISGNPSGRPKGSLNRKTIAREYLAFLQEEVNPMTGIKELLINKDMITFVFIHKAKKGCVSAYKSLMDSTYGAVKQSLELTEAETPIFRNIFCLNNSQQTSMGILPSFI